MRRFVVATRESVDGSYGRVQNERGHGRRGERREGAKRASATPETGVAKMAGLYRKEKRGKGSSSFPGLESLG